MKSQKNTIYIGTSGWVYSHWNGIFYPENLSSKEKLQYFARHFKTTEINYSFYHLPSPATYQKWYLQTPKDFLFAVKVSKTITHIKRLKNIEKDWQNFIKNTLFLKEKLGPLLFQFPPSFKLQKDTLERLEKLLELVFRFSKKNRELKYAFEFRHPSWFTDQLYELLKKYKAALVIADSPRYPKVEKVTSDFVYIRMHGSKVLFSSKYSKTEIEELAKKIEDFSKNNLEVYCYFNNDAHGYAIENAKDLIKKIFC